MAALGIGAGLLLVIRPASDPLMLVAAAAAGIVAALLIESDAAWDLPFYALIGVVAAFAGAGFLRAIGFENPFGSNAWALFTAPATGALLVARDLAGMALGGLLGRWLGRLMWG